jgi:hypothetical protein
MPEISAPMAPAAGHALLIHRKTSMRSPSAKNRALELRGSISDDEVVHQPPSIGPL